MASLGHQRGGRGAGRRGHALGRQFALLFLGQRLVGLPAGLALFLGDGARLLEVGAGLHALRHRHARPFAHALVGALLFVGRHLGIAAGHVDPAFLAAGVQAVPVVGQRGEHLSMRGAQLGPARSAGLRLGRDAGSGRDADLGLGRQGHGRAKARRRDQGHGGERFKKTRERGTRQESLRHSRVVLRYSAKPGSV